MSKLNEIAAKHTIRHTFDHDCAFRSDVVAALREWGEHCCKLTCALCADDHPLHDGFTHDNRGEIILCKAVAIRREMGL